MGLENVTFKGGLHMYDFKDLTSGKDVIAGNKPTVVTIPLSQHIGAHCECLVNVGDQVKMGQKIGDSSAQFSAPIHSSVSGEVKEIKEIITSSGVKCKAVVIESDGKDEIGYEQVTRDADKLSREEIINIVREAGIVGLGGAAFPTHVKLNLPEGVVVDTILVNGAECEPYLTADQKIMEEAPQEIVDGLRMAMKAAGASKGIVCIENNKPNAIQKIKEACSKYNDVEVATLVTKYPQGDEKRIIDAVLGREVPSGALTNQVGVFVMNAYTCHAVFEAVTTGKPLYERMVTITGSAINNPVNVRTRVGVPLSELFEVCGGFKERPGKIIVGGPMMGSAQYTIDTPVIKATGGVLVLSEAESIVQKEEVCIKCGKCVDVCPIHLQPLYLAMYSRKGQYDKAREEHVLDCIECGSCSYICPAKRALVESIKLGKSEVRKTAKRG